MLAVLAVCALQSVRLLTSAVADVPRLTSVTAFVDVIAVANMAKVLAIVFS
jgi:hypothetical protein